MGQSKIDASLLGLVENSQSLYERQYIYKHPSRHEVGVVALSVDDREENGKYITGRFGVGENTVFWLQASSYDSPERLQEILSELNDLKQLFDLFYNSSVEAINGVANTQK